MVEYYTIIKDDGAVESLPNTSLFSFKPKGGAE